MHSDKQLFEMLTYLKGLKVLGQTNLPEALARLDSHASTPYILKFQKGRGRHHKDGVRIGVGVLEKTIIVCLPGPHDEVRLTWPVLKEGIKMRWDKEVLAEALANALRRKFIGRSRGHQ